MTPFFSITASSSFFTSSKVKPYWKPEQPPPVTNTLSLRSALPSSSISCLTLFAALSLNSSGEGISVEVSGDTLSVTAFISLLRWLAARGELQLDTFGFGAVVHESSLDHRTLLDFDAFVVHVPFDPRARLEFERLGGMDRHVDGAVYPDVRGLDFTVDARFGRHHERARLIGHRGDIAAHQAVDEQAAAENDIALDARRGADQAVDSVLRFARLVKHGHRPLSDGHQVRRARLRRAAFVNPHLHALHFRLRAHPESPFDSLEVPESKLKSGRTGVRLLGKAHDSTPPPFRQVDHQLEAPVKIALPARARREQQQPVPILAGQE